MFKKVLGLGMGLAIISNSVASAQGILTPQELEYGMVGKAYTTTTGNVLTSFNVEILGVVPGGKGETSQILARAYGGIIPTTNGVIHGMSGSPVYVEGKLIGAIARGVGNDVLPYKFYITPITAMEKIWNLPDEMAKMNKIGVKEVKVLAPKQQAKKLAKEQDEFKQDVALALGKKVEEIFPGGESKQQVEATLKKIEAEDEQNKQLEKDNPGFFQKFKEILKLILGGESKNQGAKKLAKQSPEQGIEVSSKSPSKAKAEAKISPVKGDIKGEGDRGKSLEAQEKPGLAPGKQSGKQDSGITASDEKNQDDIIEQNESKKSVLEEEHTGKADLAEVKKELKTMAIKTPIRVTEFNIAISTPLDQRGLNMYQPPEVEELPGKQQEIPRKEVASGGDLIPPIEEEENSTLEDGVLKGKTEELTTGDEPDQVKGTPENSPKVSKGKEQESPVKAEQGKGAEGKKNITKDDADKVKEDKKSVKEAGKVLVKKHQEQVKAKGKKGAEPSSSKKDESKPVKVVSPATAVQSLNSGKKIQEAMAVSSSAIRLYDLKQQMARRNPLFSKEGSKYSFATGFNTKGLEFLSGMLGMKPQEFAGNGGVEIANASDALLNYKLHPGNPLGVTVAYGDFAIGATGTVTQVKGDKVISFGHPMFYKGNVNYFMNSAKVIDSAGGILNGVQVVSIGKIIGRVNQDRFAGVSGVVNSFPASVPVRVKVIDEDDHNRTVNYGVKIAYDEQNIVPLAAAIVYGAMGRTADRQLFGTARIGFAIANNVSPEGVFRRDNMYYDANDVGEVAIGELADALTYLVENKEDISNIYDINVEIRLSSARQTATITSVTADKLEVKPGEMVTFSITLQPYRSGERIISIPYIIPKDQPKGPITFEVKGGGFLRVTELLANGNNLTMAKNGEELEETTLDKLVKLADTGRNNDIIINPIMDVLDGGGDFDQAVEAAYKLSQAMEKMSPEELAEYQRSREVIHKTKYVVDNVRRITLNVVK